MQQLAGGVAAYIAGLLVVQSKAGPILHYNRLGFAVVGSMLVAIVLMYRIDRHIKQRANLPIKPVINKAVAV
ncbi:MAG: hypothetical protein ABI813_11805 [Bacteroidota bacterium]